VWPERGGPVKRNFKKERKKFSLLSKGREEYAIQRSLFWGNLFKGGRTHRPFIGGLLGMNTEKGKKF